MLLYRFVLLKNVSFSEMINGYYRSMDTGDGLGEKKNSPLGSRKVNESGTLYNSQGAGSAMSI